MQLIHDTDAFLSQNTDLYPDNYGKGADDGRFVVNDQLYITAQTKALDTGASKTINVTVRVNASIVSLKEMKKKGYKLSQVIDAAIKSIQEPGLTRMVAMERRIKYLEESEK